MAVGNLSAGAGMAAEGQLSEHEEILMSVLDPKFATVKQAVREIAVPDTWRAFRDALCAQRADLRSLLWGTETEGGLRGLLTYMIDSDPGEGVPSPQDASYIEPPLDLPEWVIESMVLSALTPTVRAVRHSTRGAPWLESVGDNNQVLEAEDKAGYLLYWNEPAEPTYSFEVKALQSYVFGDTTLFYREISATEGEYSLDGTFTPEDRARTTAFLAQWDERMAAASVPPKGTLLSQPKLLDEHKPTEPDEDKPAEPDEDKPKKLRKRKPVWWVRQVADGAGGSEMQYSSDEQFSEVKMLYADGVRALRRKAAKARFSSSERKAMKSTVAPDATVPMGHSYVEDDVKPSRLVLYLPKETRSRRKVTRVLDEGAEPPQPWVFMQGGERVPAGRYGWVLDPDFNFYLFNDDLNLIWKLETVDGQAQNLDIPPEILQNADLQTFGNIPQLLERLQTEQDPSRHRVVEVVLRHSSNVQGGRVISAGICTVAQVQVPATDAEGQPLYTTESDDGATVLVPEGDLPANKQGTALITGFEQAFSVDDVLSVADNDSGHYRPLVENHENAVKWLLRNRFMLHASNVRLVASDRSGGTTTYKDTMLRAGALDQALDHSGEPITYAELETRHDTARNAAARGFIKGGITADINSARMLCKIEDDPRELKRRKRKFHQAYVKCAHLYGTDLLDEASRGKDYVTALSQVQKMEDLETFREAWQQLTAKDRPPKNIALLLTADECEALGVDASREGVSTAETNWAETMKEHMPSSADLSELGPATPTPTPYSTEAEDNEDDDEPNEQARRPDPQPDPTTRDDDDGYIGGGYFVER
ncbi:hypothetical protein OG331_47345 [Streptomyces sp. NBC_01017]|uniref:hypothetical protein n=1 Tax=Streptomyces sp. NBC_01017 TaxID=2903721 RepID=UPI00386304B1|nr:hypothetical protein OG331_47345 [Streptomyces sp. NBC_01017]